jgi:hypothetical protein
VSVHGIISNLRIAGDATATAPISTSLDLLVVSGNLNVNGQTITVGRDFGADGGTVTMNSAADLLIVRGATSFANIDERGKLNGGTIRAAGDFENGCYNDFEFVPTGTLVVLDGSNLQHIHMCSSTTGNRFANLTIAAGAKVTSASNPVVVGNGLTINGMLTVEAGALLDVMGPAGSLSLSTGAVLGNAGTVKANLPINNSGGTITGNAVVQR